MNFLKAKNTYDENALIQKESAKKLIEKVNAKDKDFPAILEIGALTGVLTKEIKENLNYDKLFVNDFENCLNIKVEAEFIKGDIEKIALPQNLDLIISNACFQWLKDLDSSFLNFKKSLKKGGMLAFSTFGEGNFEEIKEILGLSLKYENFLECSKKYFEIIQYEQEKRVIYFKNPIEVLRHIKKTGASINKEIWTKKRLYEFEKEYKKLFETEKGVSLTYKPIYIIALNR